MSRLPNIVLITCHDLGRRLGCYGRSTVHTPSIDRLAREGALCERHFSTSSGCSPSRASIVTGRYPHSTGVLGLTHPPFDWGLKPSERHLAHLLAEAGYETALFGFQHVSPDESQLGFQRLFTEGSALTRDLCPRIESFLRDHPGYCGDSITRTEAVRPFYMEINFEEPHRPFDQGGARPDESRGVEVPPYLPQNEVARLEMAAFQGALRRADEGVGRVLHALDEVGMTEDTLLIFVADHGLAVPRAKCTLYDPGIETACLCRWGGGGIPGGRRVNGMTSHVDIVPTLLEAIDLPVPTAAQGRSFLSALRGSGTASRGEIFAEKTYHSYYDPMRAVRTDQYKLIVNFETAFAVEVPGDVQEGALFRSDPGRYHGRPHEPVELYGLVRDPLEQTNLHSSEDYVEIEVDLRRRLLDWMERTGDELLTGAVGSRGYDRTLSWLQLDIA